MSQTMRVTTEELKDAANSIQTSVDEYTVQWQALYSETETLMTNWRNDASRVFKEKLEGYRDDFERLGEVIKEYVNLLNKTAGNYEAQLEADKQRAASLYTGN